MASTRVLVIGSNPLVRLGIASLLEPKVEVGASADPAGAAALLAQLGADAVIIDLAPGDASAQDALDEILESMPEIPVLVLADPAVWLGAALAQGAAAVLPPGIDGRTLVTAVEAAAAGLAVVPRGDVERLLPDRPETEATDVPVERLTPRELEVLRLMASGLTNPRIAVRLGISEHTVKFHVTAVLGKLGARTRAEAVARAMRLGWILA
jgi:DNA-binding NarL/FixJ family response regulator